MLNKRTEVSRLRECLSLWTALCLAFQPFWAAMAFAAPEGAQVVHGDVDISGGGDYTRIEASDGAIIQYSSFDIGGQETVQFVQPSELARVLNKINEAGPTQIDGTLLANGQVYIVNPAGVMFGQNAAVDVNALVAAAGNISNEDFLSGNDHFTDLQGAVENRGQIEAGMVALVGQQVANYGDITSANGLVMLVAGDSVYLSQPGSKGFVKIETEPAPAVAGPGVEQAGKIDAADGRVVLAAGDFYSLAVRHSGATRAQTIVTEGGHGGVVEVAGIMDASDDAPGGVGGRIDVLGDKVAVHDALLDASGDAGGGSIHVGGDFQGGGELATASQTYVGSDASLRADAITSGDGGNVIVWSDQSTQFHGAVSARGGAEGGDGGFAEISGANGLTYNGSVDLRAPAGERGSVLFDPKNITISSGGTDVVDPGVNTAFDQDPASDVNFSNTSVQDALDGADVVLQANTDITVADTIDSTGNADDGDLTLQAGRNIDVNADITLRGSFTASAADPGADQANRDPGLGSFSMASGVGIDTSAANSGAGGDISITVGPPGQRGGDATGDGIVGTPDFLVLSSQLGMVGPDLAADFTGDGAVGTPDVLVLNASIAEGSGSLQAEQLNAGTAGLSLTGDKVEIADTVQAGTVTIAPTTPGMGVDLGSEASATLSLTAAELDRVDADVLHIGSAQTGNVGISDDIDPALTPQLEIESGNGWIQSATNTVGGSNLSALALDAGTGINVNTAVDSVEAASQTGDIDIANTGALQIGNVTDALTGVSIASGGGALSVTASSPLTVNEAVSNAGGGDITLSAVGSSPTDDLTVSADVTASGGSGAIALNAGDSIATDSAATVSAAGSGAVTLTAGTGTASGSIAMADGTSVQSGTGTLTLTAPGDVDVASLATGGQVVVTSTSGAITDAAADAAVDVVGDSLAARAANGIDLDTQVNSLEAASGAGAIDIQNSGALTIGGVDAGLTGVSIASGSDALQVRATGASSPLSVDEAVTHSGTGSVILAAEGNAASDDLTLNANVSSGSSVELFAGDSIATGTGAAISGSAGAPVVLSAGVDYNDGAIQNGTDTGSITMASDSTVSGTGLVLLTADQNVALTGVSGSDVDVVATDGQISDAGDAATDVQATNTARLMAGSGIGSGNALETQIATLAAGTNTGSIALDNTGSLTIDAVSGTNGVSVGSGPGGIAISAEGLLTVSQAVSAGGSGDVSLSAAGGTGTIDANALVSSDTGTVSLTADDGIDVGAGISTGNTTASAVQIDADADADAVGTLTLSGGLVDTSSGNGDVSVVADDFAVTGGSIDSGSGNVTLAPSTAISIGVGDGATGDFNVSQAEIDAISVGDPGALRIGDAGLASAVQVNDVAGGARNIALRTAAGITDADNDASNLSTTGALTLTSGAAIGGGSAQPLNVDVASVDVTGTGGNDVTIADAGTSSTAWDVATGGAGSVTLTQAANDLAVGAITTTGDVSLEATSGAISDADADLATDVSGATLAARASTGIDVDTAVGALEATTASGTLDIQNTGTLTIGGVDAGLSGVSIAGGAPATLSVTAASPLTLDEPVTNSSGGVIVLAALGSAGTDDLDVNANVTATGGDGNVTLYAGHSIDVDAAASVSAAGAGTLRLLAGTDFTGGSEAAGNADGAVTLNDGSTLSGANVILRAPADVQVARVEASPTGFVDITADSDNGGISGAITDAGADAAVDVVASNLAARAGNGIDLDTQVNAVEAASGSGAIDIQNSGALTIGGVDAGLTGVSIASGSGQLRVRATGPSSPLTVNEAVTHSGTGTVILAAEGNSADDDLAVNADVSSGASAELFAGDSITTASGVAISGGPSVVSLNAGVDYNGGALQDGTSTGAITMAADSTVSGMDQINFNADLDIALASASTTDQVQVNTVSGGIIDANGAATNIQADNANLTAATGIGSGDALETQISSVAARTDTGSIALDNTGSLAIDSIMGTNGVSIVDPGDLNGGGAIAITASSPLVVNAPVTNNAGGNITLSAVGNTAADDLTVSADVTATGGNGAIALNAGDSIAVDSGATVSAANSGPVTLTAGTGTTSGTIAMTDGTSVQSGSGTLTLTAPGDIGVANLDTGGTVSATSTSGAITDAGDTATDIVAASADLTAPGGIGTGANGALEVEISGQVDADASGSSAAAGTTTVALTAVNGTDLRVGLVQGAAGTALLTSTGGAISDAAGDPAADVVAGALGAKASSGIGLETQVGALEAETDTGGIDIANTGALVIGGVDAGLTGVQILDPSNANAGGDIIVTASSPLTVNENVVNDAGGNVTLEALGSSAGDDLSVNADVFATGGNGSVVLNAGDSIALGAAGEVFTAGSGAATLTAGTGTATGEIAMTDGSSVQSISGTLTLAAPGNIAVANVATSGQVVVSSGSGAISDAGDADVDVVANTASLSAPGGIGTGANGALEVEIGSQIDADASGSSAPAGTTTVALTAVNGTDLPLGLVQGAAGTVQLDSTAGGAITDAANDAAADVVAGALVANAASGIGSPGGNLLETSVGSLSADTSSGGIGLSNDTDLDVTLANADSGMVELETTGGANLTLVGAGTPVRSGDDTVMLDALGGDPDAQTGLILFDAAPGDEVVVSAGEDILLNTKEGAASVPTVASIGADGEFDVSLSAGNDVVMGPNQKLTVPGTLSIDAGHDTQLGDLFALTLNVNAGNQLSFNPRSAGQVLQPDGVTFQPDAGVDVVANSINLNRAPQISGGPLFFFTPSGTPPANVTPGGNIGVGRIFTNGSTLLTAADFFTVDGVIRDETGSNDVRAPTQVPPIPEELTMSNTFLMSLNQVGAKTKPVWESELVAFIECSIFDEKDLEEMGDQVPKECRDFVKESEEKDARFDTEPAIKAREGYARIYNQVDDLRDSLQGAADAYMRRAQGSGRPVTGKGFRAYVATTPAQSKALDYLNQLGELSSNVNQLSDSVETQTGDLKDFFGLLVDDVTPLGLSPDEMMEAIDLSMPATASLAAADLPISLRRR